MEQKFGRLPAMITACLAAGAAYFLRRGQLAGGSSLFSWISVAMLVVFGVYAFLLKPCGASRCLEERSPLLLGATVLAALGMLLGCASMVLDLENQLDLLLAAGGAIAAICWVVIAMDRVKGRTSSPFLFMVPALFYAIRLICDFRDWTRDPMILDYCFDLLALISIMLASFHLGGFCFGKGRRRITVFYCLCTLFFGAAAVAFGRHRELAMTGGGMLWTAANLWILLRTPEQTK